MPEIGNPTNEEQFLQRTKYIQWGGFMEAYNELLIHVQKSPGSLFTVKDVVNLLGRLHDFVHPTLSDIEVIDTEEDNNWTDETVKEDMKVTIDTVVSIIEEHVLNFNPEIEVNKQGHNEFSAWANQTSKNLLKERMLKEVQEIYDNYLPNVKLPEGSPHEPE